MFKTAVTFMARQMLSGFVVAVSSKAAREAIVGKINEMELPANAGQPGATKFTAVRAVAVAWLKTNSGRLIDTIVNALVLLTKG